MVAGGWGLNWRACGRGKAFRGWEEMDAGGSAKGVEGTVKVGQGAKSHGGSRSLLEKPAPRSLPGTEILGFPLQSAGRLV